MIAAPLLLAVALFTREPQDSVHVRGIARDTTLAVISTSAGGALRADVVLPLIGGSVSSTKPGRWQVDAPGVSFTLVDGVPFATTKDGPIPLAAAPILRNGALLLPLQILADIVPRIGNRIVWDADSREQRAFRKCREKSRVRHAGDRAHRRLRAKSVRERRPRIRYPYPRRRRRGVD